MKCNEECSSRNSGIGKFILGMFTGATLALLFTPTTGEENRKALKKKMDECIDYIKNLDAKEVKKELEQKIDDIRKDLEALDKETVVKLAKEQGQKIQKKANELYEYAKEKTTPVVQNITKDIKEKTVKVANDVIEKLENEEEKPVKRTKKSTK